LLFEKRNITIRRTGPSVRGEIQATITEKISTSESVSVIVHDKEGNVKQELNTKRIMMSTLKLQKVLSVLNGFLRLSSERSTRCLPQPFGKDEGFC
jgi:hypothetical protein